jgi:hypothetical protein
MEQEKKKKKKSKSKQKTTPQSAECSMESPKKRENMKPRT